jgi:hypothetical protein
MLRQHQPDGWRQTPGDKSVPGQSMFRPHREAAIKCMTTDHDLQLPVSSDAVPRQQQPHPVRGQIRVGEQPELVG